MEYIINVAQFEQMIDNKIIGTPELIETEITFKGINNILICDNNIKLKNVILNFEGNNSIVYLCSDLGKNFNLTIYNNSTIYIGKNSEIGLNVNLNALESQNIIIGDDCIIGNNITIKNSDEYPIYTINNKKRINFSHSIYIGDHVWLRDNVYISNGVSIGSGSIINNYTYVSPNTIIPSNVLISHSPTKIIQKDIFFTKDYLGPNKIEDSLNSKDYKSNIFIYDFINGETLDLKKIEEIFRELPISERFDFIQKLFIKNKRKNRFAIK